MTQVVLAHTHAIPVIVQRAKGAGVKNRTLTRKEVDLYMYVYMQACPDVEFVSGLSRYRVGRQDGTRAHRFHIDDRYGQIRIVQACATGHQCSRGPEPRASFVYAVKKMVRISA